MKEMNIPQKLMALVKATMKTLNVELRHKISNQNPSTSRTEFDKEMH